MNWRTVAALVVAHVLRLGVDSHFGWTYRPFQDAFDLYNFGREATVFIILFGASLAVINAILGPYENN